MNNINSILENIALKTEFRRLNTNTKINRLINAIPLNISRGIKFGYIRNDTLFLVLTHPVFKSEFMYNKPIIKSISKEVGIEVKDINCFVTNIIDKKEIIKEIELYKERSYGIFENKASNEEIFKAFERIRETIKSKI